MMDKLTIKEGRVWKPCQGHLWFKRVIIPEADIKVNMCIPSAYCCTELILNHFRITKPLTFADCVGDELPLGWEEVYDQQVGVYYIDHINSECIVSIQSYHPAHWLLSVLQGTGELCIFNLFRGFCISMKPQQHFQAFLIYTITCFQRMICLLVTTVVCCF